ncbi:hypothetical protein BU17DRAFT_82660 [Hysterangium stoloniferum]|nr:hypothetical protein BU17DRAFT_82660 [Hysterangium stoloniferum]
MSLSHTVPQPSSSAGGHASVSGTLGNTLESVVAEITTPTSPKLLLVSLRNFAKRDIGDTILASTLGGGQDPLSILDPYVNTLGYLYILSARLFISGSPIVSMTTIANFCSTFDPEVARVAPDRVHMLARGITQTAEAQHNLKAAIAPLLDLITRYPPSLAYLTTIHFQFIHACVGSQHYTAALPVLEVAISEVDTSLSPLTYHDVLNYHYIGALALLALKRFSAASSFLELVVAAPTHLHPSGLQFEALKKLTLVRLILHGATRPLPRYAHPNLFRYLKTTPYASIAKVYPGTGGALAEIVEKEARTFETDCNLGLVRQTLEHAPRWAIRKLTATYVTLSLAEIGKAIGISDVEAVRVIVLSMIEREEMKATLDAAGTVTFYEDEIRYTGADVDKLLKEAQMQGLVLGEVDREMGRSKEFLAKAVKDRDGVGSAMLVDEDIYGGGPPGYRDWDEGGF